MTRVVFLHGLESGPNGSKARFLGAHFDTYAPSLDTSKILAIRASSEAATPDQIDEAFRAPIAQALRAVEAFKPDVVVGSSFGGAVLHALVNAGHWDGPCVAMASAATAALGLKHANARMVLVHGYRDDVIPFEHSRALHEVSNLPLFLVDDDHRLNSTIKGSSPVLLDAVRLAIAPF